MITYVSVNVMWQKQLAWRQNHGVSPQASALLLIHINNLCQVCLKQASSTSLAVINCPPLLSHDSQRGWLQLGILGDGSGSASHQSPDLSFHPSLPAPFNLSTLPLVVSGWTGRTRVMSYGPSQDMVNMPRFLMQTEKHGNYNYSQ